MEFLLLHDVSIVWQLQETVWQVSEGLEGLKWESGSCGPGKKERLGLPQLAAPSAGLEGFGGFEGFEGSIRQFRASRKGKARCGTAGSSKSSKSRFRRLWRVWTVWREHPAVSGHSVAAPRAGVAGVGRFGRFEGSIRHCRANKNERCGGLAAPRARGTGSEVHTKGGPRRRPGHG